MTQVTDTLNCALWLVRPRTQGRNKQAGFTLTEIAIVLGVIGIILSQIWAVTGSVYTNYKVVDTIKSLQIIETNARTTFASMNTAANQSFSIEEGYTDSCGTPCASNMLQAASVFPSGFIGTATTSGVPYDGGGLLYVTNQGYVLWTGIENSTLYQQQSGDCGTGALPACSSGSTVLEIDLMNMSSDVCTRLLSNLMNSKIDGLVGIAAPNNGWGPSVGFLYGNSTMPNTLSVSSAATACTGSSGDFGYFTSNQAYLWIFFSLG